MDELKKLLEEAVQEEKRRKLTIVEDVQFLNKPLEAQEESSAHKIASMLNKKTFSENAESTRWKDPLTPVDKKFVTFKEMNDHYGAFLQRIQQQMSSIGGGGEVNLRGLDDVDRYSMLPNNDSHILEYDAATKSAKFTDRVGPITYLRFDETIDADNIEQAVGTLSWDVKDQTLNLQHPNGVNQQIGQEVYAYVRNGTANTITNGTSVMFFGAGNGGPGESKLLAFPMVSDGTSSSINGLGIATQDILPNEDGRITVWGKIRNVDTSQYSVGNILYGDPSISGGLTNIKPTTPNNVTPMGTVLRSDMTHGKFSLGQL
jgi:hypothetical protein